MNHKEAKIQVEICKFLQSEKIFFHAVPNEGAGGNVIRMGQMVSMGLRAGVADLVVWWPSVIGYVEVKAPGGKQKPDQIKFMGRCIERGIPYDLVYSVEDVKLLLTKYRTGGML